MGDITPKWSSVQFNTSMEILLLKAVLLVRAHTTQHDTKERSFEEVCNEFMKTDPTSASGNSIRPNWKTIIERLINLVGPRREVHRNNTLLYDISKMVTERDQLIEDVIIRMEEVQVEL